LGAGSQNCFAPGAWFFLRPSARPVLPSVALDCGIGGGKVSPAGAGPRRGKRLKGRTWLPRWFLLMPPVLLAAPCRRHWRGPPGFKGENFSPTEWANWNGWMLGKAVWPGFGRPARGALGPSDPGFFSDPWNGRETSLTTVGFGESGRPPGGRSSSDGKAVLPLVGVVACLGCPPTAWGGFVLVPGWFPPVFWRSTPGDRARKSLHWTYMGWARL